MSKVSSFSLAQAERVAAAWLVRLKPFLTRVEIAGSVRRRCARVHDVDLVAQPITEMPISQLSLFPGDGAEGIPVAGPLVRYLHNCGVRIPDSPWPSVFDLGCLPGLPAVPCQLYLTLPDGSNFGALFQMRTGDSVFNTNLAMRAQNLGWKYRAGLGLFDAGGQRLDDDTEGDLFRLLGLRLVPPGFRNGQVRFVWDNWVL